VEAGQDPEDAEDFANMTREEQLRILEQKSWVKNIDFNKVTQLTDTLFNGTVSRDFLGQRLVY
jgi:hypothetical protein